MRAHGITSRPHREQALLCRTLTPRRANSEQIVIANGPQSARSVKSACVRPDAETNSTSTAAVE